MSRSRLFPYVGERGYKCVTSTSVVNTSIRNMHMVHIVNSNFKMDVSFLLSSRLRSQSTMAFTLCHLLWHTYSSLRYYALGYWSHHLDGLDNNLPPGQISCRRMHWGCSIPGKERKRGMTNSLGSLQIVLIKGNNPGCVAEITAEALWMSHEYGVQWANRPWRIQGVEGVRKIPIRYQKIF